MTKHRTELQEQLNPPWIKPSTSIGNAAKIADARDCVLFVAWSRGLGARIIARPRAMNTSTSARDAQIRVGLEGLIRECEKAIEAVGVDSPVTKIQALAQDLLGDHFG